MSPPLHVEAREAAVKLLWEKRSMLPENSEEIVEDVISVVAPYIYLDALREVCARLQGSAAFNCGRHRGFEYPAQLVQAMIEDMPSRAPADVAPTRVWAPEWALDPEYWGGA